MIEMWKLTHNVYDTDVTQDFLDLRPSRARGHPYNVYKQGHCGKALDVRHYSFKSRVTDQWNNLPEWVVTVEDINLFKNSLDKIWYGTDVYFNHETNVHKATSARGNRRAHQNADEVQVSYIDLVPEA